MRVIRIYLIILIIAYSGLAKLQSDDKKPESLNIKGSFFVVDSHYETKQTIIIDDERKWEDFYKQVSLTNPPKVYFADEQVLIITGGQLGTTGCEIKVHDVEKTNEKIQVKYTITPPIAGEPVSSTTTTPLEGIVINKTKLPIEFVSFNPEIEEMIKKLGDDNWEVRESVTALLVKVGKASVQYLLKSIKDRDNEVKMRSRFILSQVVPQVLAQQSGWIGINMTETHAGDERVRNHIKEGVGIEVMNVIPGQPSEKYGIKQGDIIIALNKNGFPGLDEWAKRIRGIAPGTRVVLEIVRQGVKQDLEIVLGSRPKEYQTKVAGNSWDDWAQKYLRE